MSKICAAAFSASANNVANTCAATQPGVHFNRKLSYIHIGFLVRGFIDLFPVLLDCFYFMMILDNNNEKYEQYSPYSLRIDE